MTFTDPQAASVGAAEASFSATARLSEVAKTATYTRAYDQSNGFMTLLSDGERLTGAYALGPEAGEWLQQATLAIRARVPLEVLRDTIQPFPTFSEIYLAALKALDRQITTARQPSGRRHGPDSPGIPNQGAGRGGYSGAASCSVQPGSRWSPKSGSRAPILVRSATGVPSSAVVTASA